MCGICGFVGGGRVDRSVLEAMNDTMIRRGPDDRGIFFDDGQVGLGHRRLAVIDLSPAGRMPMANEKQTVHVVFNGEIFNFRELRQELETKGHGFTGRGDSEVISHLYEEYGEDFPQKLRGMFAIALWDAPRRKLVLVRDRLGIKPLYYYRGDGVFLFASELKAFMAWPGYPASVSPRGLALYLAFQYVPAPLTIFEGTRKLEPGCVLVWQAGEARQKRYWDLAAKAQEPPLEATPAEILDALDAALQESIRCRLVSDVPLGAFLSGGIDSSLVVSIMSRLAAGRVKTFTIGYWEKEYNEAPWAARIASFLGAEHTELTATPRDALEIIPQLPDIYDEPFGDASAIPTCLVSRLARRSVTVALSGDGGDEFFGGYPRYAWFLRGRFLLNLPPAFRRLMALGVKRLPHPKAPKAASWLACRDPLEFYFGMVGVWRRGELAELLGRNEGWEDLDFRSLWTAAAGMPPLRRLMLVDGRTYLPDDILTKVDRASMAYSLEARVPLLDHTLVELALRIPADRLYRRGQGKLILKSLLGRYLPESLYRRPKMGFGVPLDLWFRHQLKDLLLDHASPDLLRRDGLFNPVLIENMVKEHLSGRVNHQYALWVFLMFQMWRRRYRR